MTKAMKSFFRVVVFITAVILVTRCSENCNDCLELTTKNVVYTDYQGNNLFFGDNAIFNPDDLSMQVNAESLPILKNAEEGSFSFELSDTDEKYLIILPNGRTDTLEFDLSRQKSENCCGNKTISTKTFLNSNEINNTDIITIVK